VDQTHVNPAASKAIGPVYIARQPILDDQAKVFGYELLSRGGPHHTFWEGPSDHASARVLDDALLSVGLESLTGGRTAFLNLSEAILLSDAATLLPPEKLVLELVETIRADAETIEACRSLHRRGYTVALDDFEAGSDAEAFLPFAKFVKIDVLATPPDQLESLAKRLLPLGLRLVAEKVETIETFDFAKAAGYTFFQGYFFCKPRTFSVRSMSRGQLTRLRLLAALNQDNVSLRTIEDLLKQDPGLSYRVLRCVNSAGSALLREVHSIREAALLLGLQQIRKWASIWSLAGMNGGSPELVNMTILRARCCEQLGGVLRNNDGGAEFFLLGLCSMLDAILGRPLDAVIADLPLSHETREALLGKPNSARHVLDAVIHYERGAWNDVGLAAHRLSLAEEDIGDAYNSALAWTRQLELESTA
jgi:EAL and modified HD-GYP domain-containing signal transduction protein